MSPLQAEVQSCFLALRREFYHYGIWAIGKATRSIIGVQSGLSLDARLNEIAVDACEGDQACDVREDNGTCVVLLCSKCDI